MAEPPSLRNRARSFNDVGSTCNLSTRDRFVVTRVKAHADSQIRILLASPLLGAVLIGGGAGGAGSKETNAVARSLSAEQREALAKLRRLCHLFLGDAEPSECTHLLRQAQELRAPLAGLVVPDDTSSPDATPPAVGIFPPVNLSTRFVVALTPYCRLSPLHQMPPAGSLGAPQVREAARSSTAVASTGLQIRSQGRRADRADSDSSTSVGSCNGARGTGESFEEHGWRFDAWRRSPTTHPGGTVDPDGGEASSLRSDECIFDLEAAASGQEEVGVDDEMSPQRNSLSEAEASPEGQHGPSGWDSASDRAIRRSLDEWTDGAHRSDWQSFSARRRRMAGSRLAHADAELPYDHPSSEACASDAEASTGQDGSATSSSTALSYSMPIVLESPTLTHHRSAPEEIAADAAAEGGHLPSDRGARWPIEPDASSRAETAPDAHTPGEPKLLRTPTPRRRVARTPPDLIHSLSLPLALGDAEERVPGSATVLLTAQPPSRFLSGMGLQGPSSLLLAGTHADHDWSGCATGHSLSAADHRQPAAACPVTAARPAASTPATLASAQDPSTLPPSRGQLHTADELSLPCDPAPSASDVLPLRSDPSEVSSTPLISPPPPIQLARERSASSALPPPPRPKLLCRICECHVDPERMSEHSRACMTDVVVFHVERSLATLRKHVSTEIKRREQVDPQSPATLSLLRQLERVCADAHLTTSRVACASMLNDAKELVGASMRVGDAVISSYARQLVRQLSQIAPFLEEAGQDEHCAPCLRPSPRAASPSISIPSASSRPSGAGPAQSTSAVATAASTGLALAPTLAGSHEKPTRFTAQKISSFEILKPISRGAYGHVVLAAKKTTRDLYAIKVLRKTDMRRKNQVKRIKMERDVLATAEHPYVVKLYHSFTSREHLYLVMEFVNGGDLLSLLRAVGFLDEDTTRQYVAEISLALDYLHTTLRVVHRDIKPDNVLIHQDGHIKLTDFGLSVIGLNSDEPPPLTGAPPLGDDLQPTSHPLTAPAPAPAPAPVPVLAPAPETGQGILAAESGLVSVGVAEPGTAATEDELRAKVGTPDYMAPELLLGDMHGPPVDWWALGCLAFELLTGSPPFTGNSVEEVFELVLEHTQSDSIRWPEEDDHISPIATSLVRKLVHADPGKRLGSHGFVEVSSHAFFAAVNWTDTRMRSGTVAFLPELDDDRDTSYFVTAGDRSPTNIERLASLSNSHGLASAGTTPTPGRAKLGEANPVEEDRDFLNFSFNNLEALLKLNLELATKSTEAKATVPVAEK